MRRLFLPVLLMVGIILPAMAHAANMVFTVNTTKPVSVSTVGDTPRLALDIGGVTRYATYTAGSGSSALTFTYPVQAGDFDANGISVTSVIDLNGGIIRDANGNALTTSFTTPVTTNVKAQTYTAAFTTSPITNTNASSVAFNISKAPIGSTYTYTITSSGGSGTVSGTGTVSSNPQAVTGVNVESLPSGNLSLALAISTTAGGAGTSATNASAPTFTGVLDSLPSAAAAYSLRRLRSAYTGPLVRVRRSSDNQEQDIGYTVAGNLDTTALLTFVGSSSGFVKTWYDQSGNARHATQATAASQPRLVNAGTMDTRLGKPVANFLGAQMLNTTLNPDRVTYPNLTVNSVYQNTNASGQQALWGADNGIWDRFQLFNFRSGISYGISNGSAAVTQSLLNNLNANVYVAVLQTGVTNGSNVFVNGTAGTSFTENVGNAMSVIQIGAIGLNTYPMTGNITEFTIFTSALSTANRQTLENNQKSFYSIP